MCCQLRNAYKVTFKKNIELDIQEFLAEQASPTAFMKKLVRKEMERVGFKPTLTPEQAEVLLSKSAYALRGLETKPKNNKSENTESAENKTIDLQQVNQELEDKKNTETDKVEQTISRKRNFNKFNQFKSKE